VAGRTSCPGPARVGRLVLCPVTSGLGHRVLGVPRRVSRDQLRTVSTPMVPAAPAPVNALSVALTRRPPDRDYVRSPSVPPGDPLTPTPLPGGRRTRSIGCCGGDHAGAATRGLRHRAPAGARNGSAPAGGRARPAAIPQPHPPRRHRLVDRVDLVGAACGSGWAAGRSCIGGETSPPSQHTHLSATGAGES